MSGRGKGKTAKKSVTQSSKAGLQFPVGRVAVRRCLSNDACTCCRLQGTSQQTVLSAHKISHAGLA